MTEPDIPTLWLLVLYTALGFFVFLTFITIFSRTLAKILHGTSITLCYRCHRHINKPLVSSRYVPKFLRCWVLIFDLSLLNLLLKWTHKLYGHQSDNSSAPNTTPIT
jgi:hypothetical protein